MTESIAQSTTQPNSQPTSESTIESMSQSINKPAYVSQLGVEEVYKSNVTDNEYIIID